MPDTAYIVLRYFTAEGSEGRWDLIGPDTVLANNSDQAIRSVVSKRTANDQSGVYVAVPVRSWKPVTVLAEQQTILKLAGSKVFQP